MNWTADQIKELVNKYPYLAPHNSWTGELVEDYDYTYTEADCLPAGWHKLFYLLAKELRSHLERSGVLYTWYFTEIKEKYGSMRVYISSIPTSAEHLIDLYEYFSEQICCACGKPSTRETAGWISYTCEQCLPEHSVSTEVKHKKVLTLKSYHPDKRVDTVCYSLRPLKQKWNKLKDLSDKEFFDFMMQD